MWEIACYACCRQWPAYDVRHCVITHYWFNLIISETFKWFYYHTTFENQIHSNILFLKLYQGSGALGTRPLCPCGNPSMLHTHGTDQAAVKRRKPLIRFLITANVFNSSLSFKLSGDRTMLKPCLSRDCFQVIKPVVLIPETISCLTRGENQHVQPAVVFPSDPIGAETIKTRDYCRVNVTHTHSHWRQKPDFRGFWPVVFVQCERGISDNNMNNTCQYSNNFNLPRAALSTFLLNPFKVSSTWA